MGLKSVRLSRECRNKLVLAGKWPKSQGLSILSTTGKRGGRRERENGISRTREKEEREERLTDERQAVSAKQRGGREKELKTLSEPGKARKRGREREREGPGSVYIEWTVDR